MANLNVQKIILGIVRNSTKPFINDKYPETWLLRSFVELFDNQPSPRQKYYASQVIKKLIKEKLIVINNRGKFCLSGKGVRTLNDYELDDFSVEKAKTWDGKYRIISFDIPEDKKLIRKAVREQLVRWGFVRLQNSVWVYPYECQEVVSLLKTHFGVAKDLIYITAESIENDKWLRVKFGLK